MRSVLSESPKTYNPPWNMFFLDQGKRRFHKHLIINAMTLHYMLRLLYDIIGDFGGEVSDVGGGELAFYLPPENTGHWRPEKSAALFEVESAVDTDAMAILRAGQERPKSRPAPLSFKESKTQSALACVVGAFPSQGFGRHGLWVGEAGQLRRAHIYTS